MKNGEIDGACKRSLKLVFVVVELVPHTVQKELKNLYNALCELLRHFWSCFPANTPFLEDKVCVRIHETTLAASLVTSIFLYA